MQVDDWTAVGSMGAAVGVLFAAWQLRQAGAHARTDFEDDLSREYRELSRQIPTAALLGHEVEAEDFARAFPALFQYIDLSNEQVTLRMNGRVREATWCDWSDGIASNLARPAFARAWGEIKAQSSSFAELRRLERSGFKDDPRKWVPWTKKAFQWLSV
jgi:hypothetical protein